MFVEAVAAGVVGAALLWLVLQPIVAPSHAPAVDLDPLDPEETPRGQALLALKEIEFDRATGKLSDVDYAELNTRYSAAAIAALDATGVSPHCRVHGSRNEAGAIYCADCGAGLITATDDCAGCGVALPPDSSFCPGCGTPLQA